MSEDPNSPLPSPIPQGAIKEAGKDRQAAKDNHLPTRFIVAIGVGGLLLGLPLGVLVGHVGFGEIGKLVEAHIGAITALILFLQLGVFGEQARRLRQSVESMSAQSEQIERSIAEQGRAARAMEQSAQTSIRLLSAAHPPDLKIELARAIPIGDGAVIKFHLWNTGVSAATITSTYLGDTAPFRTDGFANSPVHNDPQIVGQVIEGGWNIEIVIRCSNVRASDRPPPPLPTAQAVGVTALIRDFRPSMAPRLSGWIGYETEGHTSKFFDVLMDCYWADE